MLSLDPKTTALVLIDLQKGIVGRELAPHNADDVISRSKALNERFRKAGGTVVLVNVNFSMDMKDALRQEVDMPAPIPPGGFPEGFAHLVEGLEAPGDLLITKRQWSAFYGTELDLQLRRRGVKTIILGGVSTNAGVESTARQAWELGYSLVFAEDIMSATTTTDMHRFAVENIFPRLGKVVQSADIALV